MASSLGQDTSDISARLKQIKEEDALIRAAIAEKYKKENPDTPVDESSRPRKAYSVVDDAAYIHAKMKENEAADLVARNFAIANDTVAASKAVDGPEKEAYQDAKGNWLVRDKPKQPNYDYYGY